MTNSTICIHARRNWGKLRKPNESWHEIFSFYVNLVLFYSTASTTCVFSCCMRCIILAWKQEHDEIIHTTYSEIWGYKIWNMRKPFLTQATLPTFTAQIFYECVSHSKHVGTCTLCWGTRGNTFVWSHTVVVKFLEVDWRRNTGFSGDFIRRWQRIASPRALKLHKTAWPSLASSGTHHGNFLHFFC